MEILEKARRYVKKYRSEPTQFRKRFEEISSRWYKELPSLPYYDKPARFVVHPTEDDLLYLLSCMMDAVEKDSSIESSDFQDIFIKTYNLLNEVRTNPYGSEYYE